MTDQPPGLKPTYGAAGRLAQIIHLLHTHPMGLTYADLQERLGVHQRTLARYIATLREQFGPHEGFPNVEVVRNGSRPSRLRFQRVRDVDDIAPGSAYELLSMYLALDLMNFLNGTVLGDVAQDLLDRFQSHLLREKNHEATLLLKDFDKKFFHWSEAPKDYKDQSSVINQVINAIVVQRELTIGYKSPNRHRTKEHTVKPLSLLMYKRALYLVGRKPPKEEGAPERDLTFAVERIRTAHVSETSFFYPEDYNPKGRFMSSFGLVQGDAKTDVELIWDPVVAENIKSRKWHPSQTFEEMDDGRILMRLNVQTGSEFMAWLQSYLPFVEVRSPQTLRDQLRDNLQKALKKL
jgi:predicted DNA-binding transcriptional regulator YafY